jgi:hypothetical protein
MNLQPYSEQIVVQKEFLYSTEMLSHKVGGITLDAAAFTNGEYVKAGTIVAINANGDESGLAQPFAAATTDGETGDVTGSFGEVYAVAHDVKVTEGVNPVVGAVQEGYLDRNKITVDETLINQIEAASNYRLRVRG